MQTYPTFTYKQGTDYGRIDCVLKSKQTRKPIPLTDAVLEFFMIDVATGEEVLRQDATVVSEQDGAFAYEWLNGGLANPGTFYAWFDIDFGDSGSISFPREGYIEIVVEEYIP